MKAFFKPDYKYTLKIAEQRLLDLGYSNFTFSNSSFTNGASFYFTSENGEKIRVSDHKATGRRALNLIQVDIIEIKKMGINKVLI